MAIVFDNTVSGEDSNAYPSVSELNQYLENMGLSTLDTADAQVKIIRATSWLENQYRSLWNTNSKTESDQALHWPQSNAKLFDGSSIASTEIPVQVKEAIYQYIIKSGSSTSIDPVQKTNLKSQELSGLGKQEFFSKNSDGSLPDDFKFIDTILVGLIKNRSGGIRILDLVRY